MVSSYGMVSPVSNPDSNDSNKPEEEKEEKEQKGTAATTTTIRNAIVDKTKAFLKSDKIGEPRNHDEFLTRNTMRLIEKTYYFMGIILALFILVALVRESIVETVLPLFTLVIGGILGFMSKDLLRGTPNTSTV